MRKMRKRRREVLEKNKKVDKGEEEEPKRKKKSKKDDDEEEGDGDFVTVFGDRRGGDDDDDDQGGPDKIDVRKPKKRPSTAAESKPRGKKVEKTEKGSKTKGRKRDDNNGHNGSDSESPSDEAASDPDSEIEKLKEQTLLAINRAELLEEHVHQAELVLSQDIFSINLALLWKHETGV